MFKIYLSPSTQEKNIGYGKFGAEEERMNILCDKVQQILSQYNQFTIYRNNPNWKLSEVITDSNYYDIDLHLAIHSNANNGKSRGCEVYCNKFDTESHVYANVFYKNLEGLTPTKDRGVKEGYNFYGQSKHMAELYKTLANAVLIEVAFHDNKDDAKWIIENTDLIAENIVDSILEIFEVEKVLENNVEFLDIESHWAKDDINKASSLGLVKGYGHNKFNPNSNLTRAEGTAMIINLYRLLIDK